MRHFSWPLMLLVCAGLDGPPAAKQSGLFSLGDREREQFLLEAEVIATHRAPGGVTGTSRVTLRRGDLTHDADIQSIDEATLHKDMGPASEIDFRDSYKNNVAAYRLDRLLGLGMVPVTVVRDYRRKRSAFTWWVDDLLMTEKERYSGKKDPPDFDVWNQQMSVVGVFDQLIFNFDRNLGNLVIDNAWRIWMIDHSRAFKVLQELRNERNLRSQCEKDFLAALRSLDEDVLRREMRDLLNDAQIKGLLVRRDQIAAFYDRLIAERGEAAVLYDLPSRVPVTR